MIITELWIPGRPVTKGSLTVVDGQARDTPQSKNWRRVMAGAIRDDLRRRRQRDPELLMPPYPGPVVVHTTWWLPVPVLQVRAGDIDKLLRNLLDALSAPTARTTDASLCSGSIGDDNQVQGLVGWKFHDPVSPGVLAVVETLSEIDLIKIEGAARGHRARLAA